MDQSPADVDGWIGPLWHAFWAIWMVGGTLGVWWFGEPTGFFESVMIACVTGLVFLVCIMMPLILIVWAAAFIIADLMGLS